MIKSLKASLISVVFLFVIPGAWPIRADQHHGNLESICIGDACGSSVATYKFDCNFADAHASDADAAAAQQACASHNYSDYAYHRTYSGEHPPSRCGEIEDALICHNK
jgi:hypothetical protein